MGRFYSNENFPQPVIDVLRGLGHDVLTSLEAGNANQAIPDDQVLAFASRDGRALLTLNRRDFFRLHRAAVPHEGIVACTVDADYPALAVRIDNAVRAMPVMTGQLVRIHKPPP